jgi:excisionase family DNA binding protein
MSQKKVQQPQVCSPEPRLLRIGPAAEYLGTTVWQMRTLVWAKKMPHLRIGKRILFDKGDLDRYIASQKFE